MRAFALKNLDFLFNTDTLIERVRIEEKIKVPNRENLDFLLNADTPIAGF